MNTLTQTRHIIPTRIVHALLAGTIVVQLLTSFVFNPDNGGNFAFQVHQYSGLVAFVAALAFWVVIMTRKIGSSKVLLFPWFNKNCRKDVIADAKNYARHAMKLKLPTHDSHAPLASAVHGLGLLLMSAMAATGTIYYFINTGNPDAGGMVGVVMNAHKLLASLVWAYLIGHASLAVLQHFFGGVKLGSMWSRKS